jgi:peptide/nickel transport system substrate-binding protein
VQQEVWRAMLKNHAENQWSIGTVSGALQPIVVKNGLTNLPAKAIYSWEPGSLIGIYRPDEMFWNRTAGKEARLP